MGDWLRRWLGQAAAGPKTAYCSFCRRSHLDVGPLAEGPDRVYICGPCVGRCGRLIEDATDQPIASGPNRE